MKERLQSILLLVNCQSFLNSRNKFNFFLISVNFLKCLIPKDNEIYDKLGDQTSELLCCGSQDRYLKDSLIEGPNINPQI